MCVWQFDLIFQTSFFFLLPIAASRMPSSHVSTPQVCRPHFHAPLPWSLSDPPKPLTSSGAWGSPFACPQDPQESKLVNQIQNSQSSSGQHLFSFPPTPPKDSTPDSVQTGPTDYQAAVNVFMHQAQASTNSQLNGTDTSSSCGLDVKPCLSGNSGNNGGGSAQQSQQAPKQREGTSNSQNSTSNNSNSNSQNLNNNNNNHASVHASNNSSSSNNTTTAHHQQHSLFDSASHQTAASYGAYENSYLGYPQSTNSVFQSNIRSSTMNNNSPSSNHKPQRTKARTSAGKIKTRCGETLFSFDFSFHYFYTHYFLLLFLFSFSRSVFAQSIILTLCRWLLLWLLIHTHTHYFIVYCSIIFIVDLPLPLVGFLSRLLITALRWTAAAYAARNCLITRDFSFTLSLLPGV
jgi:hypothetical protein